MMPVASKVAVLFLTAVFATNTYAISVGLLNSDADTGFVQSYLSPYFDVVDDISIGSSTPALATMQTYDALLVWTNSSPYQPVVLGDRLADYVDSGGGVVLATFAFQPTTLDIEGRIASAGYSPFINISANYANASLAGGYDAAHPIMAGISSLTGYYRAGGDLAPGADLIASWTDGKPLAAVNAAQNVVGLALYPGEVTQSGLSGDYQKLFANALNYVAAANGSVPVPATLFLISLGLIGFVARRR